MFHRLAVGIAAPGSTLVVERAYISFLLHAQQAIVRILASAPHTAKAVGTILVLQALPFEPILGAAQQSQLKNGDIHGPFLHLHQI